MAATPSATDTPSTATPPKTAAKASRNRSPKPKWDDPQIVVRGAREHNLKNVNVELPRDKLIVFTGLSGSGKSSLAFDTIYAEGQRRYVESLSSYARQFLGQMDKPDVDIIEGLSPAISIDQKSASRNPRSTVGTITEVYDYLRLLYARIGVQHCPNDGTRLQRQTPQQIVDRILDMDDGIRFQVLAPVVRGRKGEYDTLLQDLSGQGYVRARIDGETVDIDEFLKRDERLAKYENHKIEIVVDRLVLKEGIERRLTDSLEQALGLADGVAEIEVVPREGEGAAETLTFSQHLACRCAAPATTNRRRAISRSTRRTGPAQRVTGSAPPSRSTPS
jgi:excinuclease ABC subunit A